MVANGTKFDSVRSLLDSVFVKAIFAARIKRIQLE